MEHLTKEADGAVVALMDVLLAHPADEVSKEAFVASVTFTEVLSKGLGFSLQ